MFGIKAGIVPVTSRPNYTVHQLSWIGIENQIRIVNFLERNWNLEVKFRCGESTVGLGDNPFLEE